ncbi:MAG: MobC family plasmid mobilization relaxosome protein [Brevinema sp.]
MNRARPKQIVIRMSDEEFEAVKRKVEKSGLKQQEYLIKAITGKPVTNTDGLKEITPELKRIGVNLNQIAKTCNQGHQATYDEIHRIGEELNEVWRLLRQLAQGRVSDEQ